MAFDLNDIGRFVMGQMDDLEFEDFFNTLEDLGSKGKLDPVYKKVDQISGDLSKKAMDCQGGCTPQAHRLNVTHRRNLAALKLFFGLGVVAFCIFKVAGLLFPDRAPDVKATSQKGE